jgi:voltage-gated potassium channel
MSVHRSSASAPGAEPPIPRVRRRWWAAARCALSAGAVLTVYALVPLDAATAGSLVVLGLGLVALAVILTWQVRSVTRSPSPRLRAVEALAAAIPFFLVLFAGVYVGISRTDLSSFSEPLARADALYYAVTVFATVGFGDIVPVSTEARIATTLQMLAGLVLLGGVVRVFLGAAQRNLHSDTPS